MLSKTGFISNYKIWGRNKVVALNSHRIFTRVELQRTDAIYEGHAHICF